MKKRLLIFTLFVLFTSLLKAVNVLGGEITYKYLGNSNYLIESRIYVSCKGIPLNNSSVSFMATGGNSGNMSCGKTQLSPTLISVKEVSITCPKDANPCQSNKEGINEYLFADTVDLSKTPFSTWLAGGCCEISFFAQTCCRPAVLTTVNNSGSSFVVQAMINVCNVKKTTKTYNNSVAYSAPYVATLVVNRPFYYNNIAIDNLDKDSLAYSLEEGMDGLGSTMSYVSPNTSQYPLNPYCVPSSSVSCVLSPGSNPPRGIGIDPVTGNFVFTPVKNAQFGIVVFRTSEYRKDSFGKWVLAGYTTRDLSFSVETLGGNNQPSITASNTKILACENQPVCVKFKIEDVKDVLASAPDTPIINWYTNMPLADTKIRYTDSAAREKEIEFCWTPKKGSAETPNYTFSIVANDNNCIGPAVVIKSFQIQVSGPLIETNINHNSLVCGAVALKANVLSGKSTVNSYSWKITDSSNNLIATSLKAEDTFQMKKGGKHFARLDITNNKGCVYSFRDTFDIAPFGEIKGNLTDNYICYGQRYESATYDFINGKTNKYQWSFNGSLLPADTFAKLLIPKAVNSGYYNLRIENEGGCVFNKRVYQSVKPLPAVSLGADQRICASAKATLIATTTGYVKYYWNTGDSVKSINTNVAGNYIVTVIDTPWHCSNSDTMLLSVNDPLYSQAGADVAICNGGEAILNGNYNPVNLTAQYTWTDLKTGSLAGTQKQLKVKPVNPNGDGNSAMVYAYEFVVTAIQNSMTCESRDTVLVKVNTLPKVTMAPLPTHCFSEGDFELQDINGIIPEKSLRNGSNFKITGKRLPTSVSNKTNSSTVVTTVSSDRFVFKTSEIENEKLQGVLNYREKIYLSFTDTNGCIQVDSSKIQIVYGDPIIEFLPAKYCQNLGEVDLDKMIKRPKPNPTTLFWSFNVLSKTGTAVDLSSLIVDKNGGVGTPDEWFTFGTPGQHKYDGNYNISYCVQNKLTYCKNCDTMSIGIVGFNDLSHSNPSTYYTDPGLINVLQFFNENGTPAVWDAGDSIYISAYNHGSTIPSGAVIKNQHYFDASAAGKGTYTMVFRSASPCGLTYDTLDMKIDFSGIKTYRYDNTKLQIKPNPAKDEVVLSIEGIIEPLKDLTITDLQGKVVQYLPNPAMEQNQNSRRLRLQIKELNPGIYFVMMNSGNINYIAKMLVE